MQVPHWAFAGGLRVDSLLSNIHNTLNQPVRHMVAVDVSLPDLEVLLRTLPQNSRDHPCGSCIRLYF
jgi:hypothetical protein